MKTGEVTGMTTEMRRTGIDIVGDIRWGHGGRLWAESNQGPGATFSFGLGAATAC